MKYETPLMWLVKNLLDPLVVFVSLFVILWIYDIALNGYYFALGAFTFFITSRVFKEFELFETWQHVGFSAYGREMLMGWGITISSLLFMAFALKLTEAYSRLVLITWFLAVPFLLFSFQWATRRLLLNFRLQANLRSVVVVGGNELGSRLIAKIRQNPYLYMAVRGYFDDRAPERLAIGNNVPCLGDLSELPKYVKQQKVHHIYIALPMMVQPRIMRLLDALRDTTASIYFVPDLFVFDLAHARFGEVSGIPVIAVSETPFTGVNAVVKRATDIILAPIFLVLLSPLLFIVAVAIKLSSPGPVFFRQHRYGLDGQEILVWKFRTMNVMEDGGEVMQATRDDHRVTRIGKILRKTSLDELPQLINVIQGNMSLVGPRPHAVAHNEMYRSLIKGYMIRHKVKPGITGLAQVSGLRGETETLDKMQERIKYDLDYLRNWSLTLDLWVLLRTAFVIIRDKDAY